MRTRSGQQGLSLLGWLVVMFVAGIFISTGLTLAPLYMDSWTIQKAVQSVAESQRRNTQSPTEVRKAIAMQFMTNRVDGIKAQDIKISKEKGVMIIDATYEKRVPLFYNVDAVVKFDHLVFEVTPSGN